MAEMEIPQTIFDQLVAQAKAEAPLEACGILAGRNGAVEKFYPMTNVNHSSVYYMMAPREQFDVVKDIRAAGRKMLAIYHSHPETPARPSAEDKRLAYTPGVIYLILSLQNAADPVLKGFHIEDGVVTETPVEINE